MNRRNECCIAQILPHPRRGRWYRRFAVVTGHGLPKAVRKSRRVRAEVVRMAITIYGVCAVTFMMAMYALEGRDRVFVLLFALGCLLSSVYGFLSGAWPF